MSASQTELLRLLENKSLKYLYLPEPPADDGQGDELQLPKVTSAFPRNFTKMLWHSNTSAVLDATTSRVNSDNPTYTVSTFHIVSSEKEKSRARFHGNRYLYTMTGKFPNPNVKVKDEHQDSVRIAMTPDAGVYSCVESRFKVGDIVYCSVSDTYIDDWYQWCRTIYTGPQPTVMDMNTINESLLNLSKFTEWTSEVQGSIAEFLIPHFYSASPGSAFPLFLVDDSVKITQEIVHPTNPVEYLYRAQVSEDGTEWVDVKIKDVMRCLEISGETKPSLLADFFDISPQESDENKNFDLIEIPIQRAITITPPNATPAGISAQIPINTTDPIVALFAKAYFVEALEYNNRSNCTNMLNENDPRAVSAISSLTLKYGQSIRFNYRSEDMRSNRMYTFFPAVAHRKGRFAHAFCRRPFDPTKLAGMVADNELKAVLYCHMTGNTPENNEKNDYSGEGIISQLIAKKKAKSIVETSDDSSNRYIPKVTLLIHNDLVIEKNKEGTFDFSIR
jgi:hypothetical protein